MREEKALAERKRQLDKTLATAPADNQKGRKKPRIVKLARQPAIEHPAARPNFVHSPHRKFLNTKLSISKFIDFPNSLTFRIHLMSEFIYCPDS